jgi:hypothetical protein
VNSHAAGMVSVASGKNISPKFGSVTSVKKKVDIFCCEKAISIGDFQSKYWNALRTGLTM